MIGRFLLYRPRFCVSTKPKLDFFLLHADGFRFAPADVEFVDEVGGTGVLVDDEQHVADVNVDGALQFGFEVDVAAHGFPVAVKGQTDEFALTIHDGAAGVTTGDIVSRQEAHDEFAVVVGVGIPETAVKCGFPASLKSETR